MKTILVTIILASLGCATNALPTHEEVAPAADLQQADPASLSGRIELPAGEIAEVACSLGGLDLWMEGRSLELEAVLRGDCGRGIDVALESNDRVVDSAWMTPDGERYSARLETDSLEGMPSRLELILDGERFHHVQPLEVRDDAHGWRLVAPTPVPPSDLAGPWHLSSRDLATGESTAPFVGTLRELDDGIAIYEGCAENRLLARGTVRNDVLELRDPATGRSLGTGNVSPYHLRVTDPQAGIALEAVRLEAFDCANPKSAPLVLLPFAPLMDPVEASLFTLDSASGYQGERIMVEGDEPTIAPEELTIASDEPMIAEPVRLEAVLPSGRAHLMAAQQTAWLTVPRRVEASPGGAPICRASADTNQPIPCPSDTAPISTPYSECTTEYWSEEDMISLANRSLLQASSAIYPGALIQGRTIANGAFAPITIPRSGGMVTITGVSIADPNLRVDELSFASIEQARQTLIRRPIESTAANASWRSEQVFSTEDLLIKAGAHVGWAGGSVSGRFRFDQSSTENHVLVMFTQGLYTLSVPMPVVSEQAFRDGENFDDSDFQIGPNNRPVYVNDVTFGRQLFLLVRSNHSVRDIQSSIDVAVGNVKVEADARLRSVLEGARVDYVAIGGDVEYAAAPLRAIGNGSDVFQAIAATAANLQALRASPANAAEPIRFSLYDLLDRSQLRAAYSISYNRRDCRMHSARPFDVQLHVRAINRGVRLWIGDHDGDPDVEVSQRHPSWPDYAAPTTVDLGAHFDRLRRTGPVRVFLEHDNSDCFRRFADLEITLGGRSEWRETRADDGWGHCGTYRSDELYIDRDAGTFNIGRSWRW